MSTKLEFKSITDILIPPVEDDEYWDDYDMNDDLDAFKEEIGNYSLDNLNRIYKITESALNILIQHGIAADTSSSNDPNEDIITYLYTPLFKKMEATQNEILEKTNDVNIIDSVRKDIEKIRDGIHEELSIENALINNGDNHLLVEFLAYRREDTYTNSNFISDGLSNSELIKRAREFYDRAEEEMLKSENDQHTISASLKNLLVMKEFSPIRDNFSLGNRIHIGVDGKKYKLRLIEYEIDYENLSDISVQFSDVTNAQSNTSDIKDILDKAVSISSSYNATAYQSKQGVKSKEKLDSLKNDGINADEYDVYNGSINKGILWNNNGFIIRDYDDETEKYDKRQIKILNNGIYLTDDNWETNKLGIGLVEYEDEDEYGNAITKKSYGVNAQVLYGELLIGKTLKLNNKDNSMMFTENGLKIKSNHTYTPDNDSYIGSNYRNKVDIDVNGSNLFKIYATDDNPLFPDINLVSVTGENVSICNWAIQNERISCRNSTIPGMVASSVHKINLTPSDVDISGKQIGISNLYATYSYDSISLGIDNGDENASNRTNTVFINGETGSAEFYSVFNVVDNTILSSINDISNINGLLDALEPVQYTIKESSEFSDGSKIHYGFNLGVIKSYFDDNGINTGMIRTGSNGKQMISYQELHAIEISLIKSLMSRVEELENE